MMVRSLCRYIIVLIFVLLGTGVCSEQAFAQPRLFPENSNVVVDEIVLKGNRRNPNEDLLYYIKQSTGVPLSRCRQRRY